MKFKIKDECGKTFDLEKKDLPNLRRFKEESKAPIKDEAEKDFTADEIKLLKKLLEKADDLLDLLKEAEKEDKAEEKEKDEDEDEEVEEESEDEVEVGELDSDEELLSIPEEEEGVTDSDESDEDEGVKAHDSKKSFGAIEKKSTVEDSISRDEEIAQAWAKRYGGNK